jgi:hypothetical protein
VRIVNFPASSRVTIHVFAELIHALVEVFL